MNNPCKALIGVVVIGRNEMPRLERCLASVRHLQPNVVYVDSGSHDGSCDYALSNGFKTHALDSSRPFSAARARNEGWQYLVEQNASIEFIQFVDGDCEIDSKWVMHGAMALMVDDGLAVAAGQVREAFPTQNVYSRLCNIEWRTTPGYGDYCGGIFMVRSRAFQLVDGFEETLIAGEDPELCVRLRLANWKIRHLDSPMATHYADISHFRQWLQRSIRAGFAYAEGAALHGPGPTQHWVRESRSNWIWGVILPAILILAAWPTAGWSIAGFLVYPLQAARIALKQRRNWGESWYNSIAYGAFTMVGKFSSAFGQALYWKRRLLRTRSRLIEYKTSSKCSS